MYNPFEQELRFALHYGLPKGAQEALAQHENWDSELIDAVLSEAAKFATTILAPLNHSGDQAGCRMDIQNTVTTPDGFVDAHQAMIKTGWHGIEASEEFGGQNLPKPLVAAVNEMFYNANLALTLCQLLNMGQIHALELYASQQQKALFLPKMISGAWVGTMNLTEAQAGSDLGALRTRATRSGNHFLLHGQKIFITFGEHDLAENISHLVLARIQGAAQGHKGLSLFLVPKFLPDNDGNLGQRNDVKCVSIEHKLGIKASPTAVLQYGDQGGAIGFLVGKENQGLDMMFAMMNHARFTVGVQGVAIAARAFSQAQVYAQERIQGTPLGGKAGDPIAKHPDVQRLLGTMASELAANRALMIYGAALTEGAKHNSDLQTRAELFIPIFKGYATERALRITSDGVQVHGGMGFIEETGAAQHYRDARILPIYEGTTAIQANDLVFRKTLRDQGAGVSALLDDVATDADKKLRAGCDAARAALTALLEHGANNPRHAAAVGVPFLMMLGALSAGWLLEQSARNACILPDDCGFDADFLGQYDVYKQIFDTHLLPEVHKYAQIVINGAESIESFES